jgi:hypothetical protein
LTTHNSPENLVSNRKKNIFANIKNPPGILNMQALTNRAQEVSRKPMSFMERLYIPAILKGMAITFSHIFKKQPTIRYPFPANKHDYIVST